MQGAGRTGRVGEDGQSLEEKGHSLREGGSQWGAPEQPAAPHFTGPGLGEAGGLVGGQLGEAGLLASAGATPPHPPPTPPPWETIIAQNMQMT